MLNAKNTGEFYKTIKINNRERSYLIHIPDSVRKNKPAPLVIVIHGAQANAQKAEQITGMSVKSENEGFIVAYPNGTGIKNYKGTKTWNAGNCCGPAYIMQINDVGFISELINEIQKNYNIDKKRIYILGISNGGMLAYILTCKLSDKIASIADITGAMNITDCSPTQPVSVLIVHGTADPVIRYEGGKPLNNPDWIRRLDNPTSYALSFWSRYNQCSQTPTRNQYGDIIKETYTNCSNETEVTLYTIVGGGHYYPETINNRSSADIVWEFFKSHPKK
jgi:polyhydroxybutyrate depolymerase